MSDNIQKLLIDAFNLQKKKVNEFDLNPLDYGASPINISTEQQHQIDIVDSFIADIKSLIEEKMPDIKTFKEVLKLKKQQLKKASDIMFAFDDILGHKKGKEIDIYTSLDKAESKLICEVELLKGIEYVIPQDPTQILTLPEPTGTIIYKANEYDYHSNSESEFDSDGSY
jgi:hypothetical protein